MNPRLLTFALSKLVSVELQACRFCFRGQAKGSREVMACPIDHEVHFLRLTGYRDQQHQLHTWKEEKEEKSTCV